MSTIAPLDLLKCIGKTHHSPPVRGVPFNLSIIEVRGIFGELITSLNEENFDTPLQNLHTLRC